MKYFLLIIGLIVGISAVATQKSPQDLYYMIIKVNTKEQRTQIANLGIAIEAVEKNKIMAFGDLDQVKKVRDLGWLEHSANVDLMTLDFPPKDEKFHDYKELTTALQKLENSYPNIVSLNVIGKTVLGRNMYSLTITKGSPQGKAEILFVGGHHAREHLSVELPLSLAKYIASEYTKGNAKIKKLVENRVIHIVPAVNPDGLEYDIEGGNYKMWRKNRRVNRDGSYGVDLNRNYDHKFGTIGASSNPKAQTYHGPKGFSEPETQAIRDFVKNHSGLTTLVSFHTFSELILYPWGYTYDPVKNQKDRKIFTTMAKKMSTWNGYTPQQSSGLYRTSGDTSDWAYGIHKLISFTFELDPKSMWSGGFYPGQKYIDIVFSKNLKPALYLIEYSDNPSRVLEANHIRYGLSTPIID